MRANMLSVQPRPMKVVVRNKWSADEVERLEAIIEEMGDSVSWSEVAQRLGSGRTAKQCRFRWLNGRNSKSDTKTGSWEHMEEFIIASEHVIRGPSWARTARLLVCRTENTVKNHWNGIYRSSTLYRPCSLLWHYVRLVAKHEQPRDAFYAAVEAWCQVVPAELSSAVIQEFKAWQVDNQPGGLAVQLPNPPAVPTGPSASKVNLKHFKPETRYHPDAIANMKVSLRDAVTTLMAPSHEAPARPAVQRRAVRSSVAAVTNQLHNYQPIVPGAVQQEQVNTAADQVSCPASPASLAAATTAMHNLGHTQVDAGSAPLYIEAGMQLPQSLQAGQVVMIGNQAYQVMQAATMDNREHLPLVGESAPVMRAAALPGSGNSMPVMQMMGLRSQASATGSQVCSAFSTHAPVAAGRMCTQEPAHMVDLREPFPFPMSMMMGGAQYQSATRESAPLMAQPAPAFLREIAVPPPEPTAFNWSAPAEVPQTYMAAPPSQFTAVDRVVVYQNQAQPGMYIFTCAP